MRNNGHTFPNRKFLGCMIKHQINVRLMKFNIMFGRKPISASSEISYQEGLHFDRKMILLVTDCILDFMNVLNWFVSFLRTTESSEILFLSFKGEPYVSENG